MRLAQTNERGRMMNCRTAINQDDDDLAYDRAREIKKMWEEDPHTFTPHLLEHELKAISEFKDMLYYAAIKNEGVEDIAYDLRKYVDNLMEVRASEMADNEIAERIE